MNKFLTPFCPNIGLKLIESMMEYIVERVAKLNASCLNGSVDVANRSYQCQNPDREVQEIQYAEFVCIRELNCVILKQLCSLNRSRPRP